MKTSAAFKCLTPLAVLLSSTVWADAFDTCPSKAYLFQSEPVQVYGVNLVTGLTTLLQGDTGLDANINGVGFDFDSRYIYGYDTTNKQIVRLGKDFQAEVLNTSGLPTDHTFFVGDVYNKYYYLYRKNRGLFRIDLTPLDTDPNATLIVEQISETAVRNLTDFAFHPGNGKLYGVDNNNGYLYEFSPTTGDATYIGDTGHTGTFGAGYFDVNGYYYISRNSDGHIFRINLSTQAIIDSGNVPAEPFALGPDSKQNDGARCANAPVIDEDSNIDFGDAPDTYSTTLASNGPRHEIDSITWLGSQAPDGEADGFTGALTDDTTGTDDEDGFTLVTPLEAGLDAIAQVSTSTSGYLSVWIDWNLDGDFADENEHVISDQTTTAGLNSLFFEVPVDAQQGTSWARVRFSQQQGLDYFGGSTSGEVEDHQVYIVSDGVSVRHYPNASSYATVAFEDNWPYEADYDMNDVVVHFRITEFVKNNQVQKAVIQGRLGALGADYRNGFAIRLQGLQRSELDTDLTRQYHNQQLLSESGVETDANETIFIVSDDLSTKKTTGCRYFRTQNSCKQEESFAFEIRVSMKDGADVSSLVNMPYDPFVFATPGYFHGAGLPQHPGRSYEIHLPGQAPTEKFNTALFGLGDDASNPDADIYYKTAANYPWALLINQEWQWPTEFTDLVEAYPNFANFAQQIGDNDDWYQSQHAITPLIYTP